MKRTEPKSIETIIREAIEASNLTDNFERQRANAMWADVVGPEIASQTMRRYINGSVLHVYISSASLKNELQLRRHLLLKLLNEAVGSEALTDLRIH